MRISIGIMLWNEENSIAMTIDSVFAQTLFREVKPEVESIEVVALANGCTDASIPNARAAFERNLKACTVPYVSARVEELPKGRQPAWNKFVHEMTPQDTTFIFFMDADIYIDQPDAMWSMVKGLADSDHHPVAAALGIKDIEKKPKQTLWERISMSMTNMERHARLTYLCGGLYCGRAGFFKRIWFPEGWVCGDDAFIARMAVTSFMTHPLQFDRILHPPEASFVFEAYTSIWRLFRQNRRRMIGATVISMIYEYIAARQSNGAPDAGQIIRSASETDPNWLDELVRKRTEELGFFVVPWQRVWLRWSQLRTLPWQQQIAKLPLAIAGMLWTGAVILASIRQMRAGKLRTAWENMKNTRMMSIQPANVAPTGASRG